MKFTYILISDSENILQTEYPKLILNKNTYSNKDIPYILKDITRIDKVDITDLQREEKEIFKKEILDKILKKWLQLENTIFIELDKLFYVFFYLYTSSKKFFLVSCFKNLIKFCSNLNINFYSIYKKHRTIKNFCALYNIESAKDCLKKIFEIFESIDSFLAEMRQKISLIKSTSHKLAEILDKKLFSYDVTIYSIFLAFKEFFINIDDCFFLKNSLKNFSVIKYEQYRKENEILNMMNIDDEDSDYLGLDYLKYKNKNFSENVIFFNTIIKSTFIKNLIKLKLLRKINKNFLLGKSFQIYFEDIFS